MTTTTDGMTKRQREVYDLATEGKSAAEMARGLGITTNAVHSHLKTLRARKLLTKTNRPRQAETAGTNGSTAVAASSGDVGRSVIAADIAQHVPSLRAVESEIDERISVLEAERARLAAMREAMRAAAEPTPA